MTDFDEKALTWDADPARVRRAEVVAAAMRAVIPLREDMAVFEYGCGTGLLGFALKPFVGSITLADGSTGMLEELRRRIASSGTRGMTPVLLDLMTEPTPNDRYDCIVNLLVLHHVPDVARLMAAFHVMLKPSGYLAVADLDCEDGSFHGPDFTGHRGFVREDLAALAGNTGFTNIRFSTVMDIEKQTETGRKRFPLFLMTAEKKGSYRRMT